MKLDMSEKCLNKKYCLMVARTLIKNGSVKNMSVEDLTKEIYAHAVCYYWYNDSNILHSNKIAYKLHKHGADGIDITDGGDTLIRKNFYSVIWNLRR